MIYNIYQYILQYSFVIYLFISVSKSIWVSRDLLIVLYLHKMEKDRIQALRFHLHHEPG